MSTEIKKHILTLAFFAGVIIFLLIYFRKEPGPAAAPVITQQYDSTRAINLTVNLNTPGTQVAFPTAEKPAPAIDSAQLASIIKEIILGAEVHDSAVVRDTAIEAVIKTIIQRNRLKDVQLSYRWLKPISTEIRMPPPPERFKLSAGAFVLVPDTGKINFGPVLGAYFPKQSLNTSIGRDLNSKSWLFQFSKTISIK